MYACPVCRTNVDLSPRHSSSSRGEFGAVRNVRKLLLILTSDGARACAPLSGSPPPKKGDSQIRRQQRGEGKNYPQFEDKQLVTTWGVGSRLRLIVEVAYGSIQSPTRRRRLGRGRSRRCRYHCKLQRLVRRKNGREIAIRGSDATIFFLPPHIERFGAKFITLG